MTDHLSLYYKYFHKILWYIPIDEDITAVFEDLLYFILHLLLFCKLQLSNLGDSIHANTGTKYLDQNENSFQFHETLTERPYLSNEMRFLPESNNRSFDNNKNENFSSSNIDMETMSYQLTAKVK